MNRDGLIKRLSEAEKIPLKEAKTIVDLVFTLMGEALKRGERIEIRGFGTFAIRNYRNYTGRNPKTGQLVDVSPKKLPFFKAGKEFKEMVNREAKGGETVLADT